MSMTKRRVSPRLFACRLAWLDRARVFVVQPVRFVRLQPLCACKVLAF